MNSNDRYNEIIFYYRNKLYGAYVMRKNYRKQLFYSLLIAVFVFIMAFAVPLWLHKLSERQLTESPVYSEFMVTPPLDKIQPDNEVNPELLKLIKKAKFVAPVVVTDFDDSKDNTDEDAQAADSANNGTSYNGSKNGVLDGNGSDDNAIYTYVQEMPEFPGGDVAFSNFLQKNIRYPQLALKNRIQGRVYVSFIVEKNGTISNIKILQGIGAGCDDEALRVMRLMPKWKAGKNQGHEIRVIFQKPINFVLQTKSL